MSPGKFLTIEDYVDKCSGNRVDYHVFFVRKMDITSLAVHRQKKKNIYDTLQVFFVIRWYLLKIIADNEIKKRI